MNEELKVEYQELKSEFAVLSQMISNLMTASVAACVLVFSLVFPKIEPENSFFLFWLPLLIIYPACLLISSRIQATHRISAYIIVFIESKTTLKFETRLTSLKQNKNLYFRRMALLIFAALIVFDIAIFVFKGYNNKFNIISYCIAGGLFLLIYRWLHQGWTRYFIKKWTELKDEEEGLAKSSLSEQIITN